MFYFIMCTLIVKYSVKSCYCCLFYVLAFQDQHTLPKWNILWKAVIVACSMYWPFRTSTPSQSEIFCLKALIVDLREYFTLGGCAGPERPIATITALRQNISLWEGVLVLKGQYIEQATITALRQNISLWEGVLVLKGQYIEQETITALETEYFTLGGCAGPERPIHRTSNNNSFETEYFTLGGCAGPQRG